MEGDQDMATDDEVEIEIRVDPGTPEGDVTVVTHRDSRTGEFVREIRVNSRDVGKTAELEGFTRQMVAQFGESVAQAHGQPMERTTPEEPGFMCKRKIRFTHRLQALASLKKGEDWEEQFRREESRIEPGYRTEVDGIFVEALTPGQRSAVEDFFRHREQQLRADAMGPAVDRTQQEFNHMMRDAVEVGRISLDELRRIYDGDPSMSDFDINELLGWGK